MKNIVIKGGGTTNNDAEAIDNFCKIIAEHYVEEKPDYMVAFASAPGKIGHGGLEDKVTNLCEIIFNSDSVDKEVSKIITRFTDIISNLNLNEKSINYVNELTKKLVNNSKKSGQENKDSSLYAEICSIGERFSSKVISEHLKKYGLKTVFIDYDQFGMECTGPWNDARITKNAEQLIKEAIIPYHGKIVVAPPFIGYKIKEGEKRVACMGRGASDWSATKVGEIIGASEIYIYSDQPGLLRADPGLFHIDAKPDLIKSISYEEAIEFAGLGASIILEKAIKPAQRARMNIHIIDSTNPKNDGTVICYDSGLVGVKALATIEGYRRLLVRGTEKISMSQAGITGEILSKFGQQNVDIKFHVDSGKNADTYFYQPEENMGIVEKSLGDQGYELETRQPMTRLTIIGEGVSDKDYLEMLSALVNKDIQIRGNGFGGEKDITRTVFVDGRDGRLATRLLYNKFFNDKYDN